MTAAVRQQRVRDRRRDGRIVLTVEADHERLTVFLCQAGLLGEHQIDDRGAVTAALQRSIELSIGG